MCRRRLGIAAPQHRPPVRRSGLVGMAWRARLVGSVPRLGAAADVPMALGHGGFAASAGGSLGGAGRAGLARGVLEAAADVPMALGHSGIAASAREFLSRG